MTAKKNTQLSYLRAEIDEIYTIKNARDPRGSLSNMCLPIPNKKPNAH